MGRRRHRKINIALLILLTLLLLPFASLLILSKIHHQSIHEELTEIIEQELNGEATFSDLSINWVKSFPNLRGSLYQLSVPDRDAEAIHIDQLDFILNPLDLLSGDVRIKKVFVNGGKLRMFVDSAGNKPAIFTRKNNSPDSKNNSFLVEADKIVLEDIALVIINQIKGNRIYAGIDKASLKLEATGKMLYLSGALQGSMDSLIANKSKLISEQPFTAQDIIFSINKKTGSKQLERGYMMAQNLKLIPQLMLEPDPEGQIITFQISTENTFDSVLGLLMFHTGLDIQQKKPDAILKASFNQQGLINPWVKPYTAFDFEVSNAEFSGESLPYPLTLEKLKGNYNNGEKHTNETAELVFDTIVAEIQESYVNARLKLTNLRDPQIDASFISSIDLAHLPKQSDNYNLTGSIEADMKINGRISELKAIHLEGKQHAVGSLKLNDIKLELLDDGHIIGLSSGTTLLNNHMLEVSNLIGSFNQSAFHFQGMFHNLDQFFQDSEEELNGTFNLEFDKLDLRKLKQENPNPTAKPGLLLPYKNNSLTLKITGNEIITDYGVLKNIRVNSTLNDDVLSYSDLYFNMLDGTVSGAGEAKLSDTSISTVQSNLDLVFNRINIDSLIKRFAGRNTSNNKSGMPTIPFEVDAHINFEAAELAYKDALVTDAKTKIDITNNNITINQLNGSLPFGKFYGDLDLTDFTDENPKIRGELNVKIDSLFVDEMLQMEAFAKTSAEDENKTQNNPDYLSLTENTDLTLLLDANYLAYQNAAIHDVELNMAVQENKINLNDLQFEFSGGDISLNGYLENDGTGKQPGYLYSFADSVDISSLLDAFDQFGQDKFTSLNSDGAISWSSHYYFGLDEDFEPKRMENLMILNFDIHDATFIGVEPIEKTLFFAGYKSKEHMMVEDLNISAFLFQDKLYFLDLLMNDNIANLDAFGLVEIQDREMDVSLEISLSDLFFRSKKKRRMQTQQGIVNLDDDAKLFINLQGPLNDHKLDLISKKHFEEQRKQLIDEIRNAENEFKAKHSGLPGV